MEPEVTLTSSQKMATGHYSYSVEWNPHFYIPCFKVLFFAYICSDWNCVRISNFSVRTICPVHFILHDYDHPRKLWKIQIMELLVMQFSPSCYFLPPRSNIVQNQNERFMLQKKLLILCLAVIKRSRVVLSSKAVYEGVSKIFRTGS